MPVFLPVKQGIARHPYDVFQEPAPHQKLLPQHLKRHLAEGAFFVG